MAYVSHSGTNNTSQYDWKVLIFMVLLLAAILVFVAAKFIYPEIVTTGVVVPAQAINTTSMSSAPKSMVKTDAAAVGIAEKKEVIPTSAPKVIASTVKSAPSSSTTEVTAPVKKEIAPATQSDTNGPALVSSEANTQSGDLRCSDSDRTAGLCK